ncbi:MAG: AAA family ATPase [Bacteroidales bacterium]|jgi:DNA repair exonuclease SbcCD ATPase subunit
MIIFEKIRFKNIMSFGDTWTELDLNRNSSTLIVGTNGSGKSTIQEAIVFALFGKSFRKTKKINKLINFKNNGGLLIEIFFKVNNVPYMVRRGMKPNIFEIYKNGYDEANLLNQDSSTKDYQQVLEKQILHFNYDSFNQIVILGKATYICFMKLEKNDKRKFIESMLKLDIFSNMNEVHKSKVSILKEDLNKLKTEIAILNERIQIQERYVIKLKSDDENQRKEYIEKLKIQYRNLKKESTELLDKNNELKGQIQLINQDDITKLNERVSNLNKLKVRTDVQIKQLSTNINFFTENTICPTCTQEIHDDYRSSKLDTLIQKSATIDQASDTIEKQLELSVNQINTINTIINSNRKIENEINIIGAKMNEKRKQLIECNELINATKNITEESKVSEETHKLKELNDSHKQITFQIDTLLEKYQYFDIITQMLKDSGIKQTIIKKYIPIINNLVNVYLAKMGFYVRFVLDDDFNETIYARGIEELSYGMFSEGEKQRIDIALLFAWRDIARLQNDFSTNLIFFDEVLDGSGDSTFTESMIELFNSLQGENIFVITHSEDKWADKFRSTIKVERRLGFSIIAN